MVILVPLGQAANPTDLQSLRDDLQASVASQSELDGVRVDGIAIDEGMARVSGIVARPDQRESLLRILQQCPAPTGTTWVLGALKAAPVDRFLTDLYGTLGSRAELGRVRVDRAYFDKDGNLAFAGVMLVDQPEAIDPAHEAVLRVRDLLEDTVMNLVVAKWPDYQDGGRVIVEGIRPIRSPVEQLQRIVADSTVWDGLRIDAAYYSGRALGLRGIQASPRQADAFREFLARRARDSTYWHDVAPAGVQCEQMQVVPLDSLLSRARRRIASLPSLSGTWLARAYYGKLGQLVFEVHRWKSAPKQLIQSTLQDEVQSSPVWRSAIPQIKPGAVVPEVRFTAEEDDLLQHLRQFIWRRPSLDGVRLDRAFYDDNHVLHLAGLLSSDSQVQPLRSLVSSIVKSEARWQGQVPHGFAVRHNDFYLLPVGPLLGCVREVLLEYPELDGAVIQRLFHGPTGALVADVRVTAAPQAEQLTQVLSRELAQTQTGRTRLAMNAGDMLVLGQIDNRSVTFDSVRAESLLSTAWQQYWQGAYHDVIHTASEIIDSDPTSLGGWYLRALGYIQVGDLHLARRDLRRAVARERTGPFSFASRGTFLTRVQGEKRLVLERLRREALLPRKASTFIGLYCPESDLAGAEAPDCDSPLWRCLRCPAQSVDGTVSAQ